MFHFKQSFLRFTKLASVHLEWFWNCETGIKNIYLFLKDKYVIVRLNGIFYQLSLYLGIVQTHYQFHMDYFCLLPFGIPNFVEQDFSKKSKVKWVSTYESQFSIKFRI